MILQKEFYFVRHGQTDHNLLEGPDKGDHTADISLNEMGKNQAKTIAPLIATLPIQIVVASPMKRAQETKDIITLGLQVPHYAIDALGECSFGLWKEIRALSLDSAFPQEGQLHSFISRVARGLNEALSLRGPSLIVAHGGIHWIICFLMKIEEHDDEKRRPRL